MVAFRTLGGLVVVDSDVETNIGGPRQRRLLAMLLIHRDTVVSTDRLAEVVFDGEPTPAAATTLRSYVARLRRVVESDASQPRLHTQSPGYRLAVPEELLDAATFERLVQQARGMAVADPSGAGVALQRALALWHGRAYDEFADEEWAMGEVRRLEELRLGAYELLFDLELAAGRSGDLVAQIEPIATAHPLREPFHVQLMTALYRAGRQADALRAYQQHRRVMVEELGLEPGAGIQELEQRILAQDLSLVEPPSKEWTVRAYRLVARLGVDRDGAEYSARLPGSTREFLVRATRGETADDPAFVRTFEADARRAAALRHPAILPISDFWREPGAAYVVTPRLHGGSLADRVANGPLPNEAVDEIARRIGGALVVASHAGVVHGHVEPANVHYDDLGDPVLSGFSLGSGTGERTLEDDVRDFVALMRSCAPSLSEWAQRTASVDPLPGIDVVVEDVQRLLAGSDPVEVPRFNPYKGLLSFDEADAPYFFGRDDVVDDVVARLEAGPEGRRLVLVVGGSGSGKSSIVRAGVIPRVRAGSVRDGANWLVTTMLPGTEPFVQLADALGRISATGTAPSASDLGARPDALDRAVRRLAPGQLEVLLVIDQLEELFTLASERTQRAFLDAIVHAVSASETRISVLATMRADFFDRPLAVPGFGALVRDSTVTVAAMSAAEIEAAIVEPAERVGRSVERPLVAELVAAVADQPAALPALQFALFELAEICNGPLTVAAYRKIGGVSGAIATRAEELYGVLDDEDRAAFRRVAERLVVVHADSEPTRRTAARSELTGEPPEPGRDALVDRWAAARLLTLDRHPQSRVPTVEVAHEALLREWPRLRHWLDEDREALAVMDNLRHAAATWAEDDRDSSELYRGARLEMALDVAAERSDVLPDVEREFLDASAAARDEALRDAEMVVARQARTNRRLRRQLALVALALVVALVGGFVAIDQRRTADRERRTATARELAAAADATRLADPDLSTLLALAAVDATRSHGEEVTPQVVRALHTSVSSDRLLFDVPDVGGSLDWSPDGAMFVTEGPEKLGVIDIRDAATGRSLRSFHGHDVDVNDVVFTADGKGLVTAGDDGALRIWNPRTGEMVFEHDEGVGTVWAPAISLDGAVVAAAWYMADGIRIKVFDVSSGAELVDRDGPNVNAMAFSPDGSTLAIGSLEGQTYVADIASGDYETIGDGKLGVNDVAYSPDGTWLATAGGDGVRLWDAKTLEPGPTIAAHVGAVNSVDWGADSSVLATGGADGKAKLMELVDGGWRERYSFAASSLTGGVYEVALSPDSSQMMTSDYLIRSVKVWDLAVDGAGELFNLSSTSSSAASVVWTADDRIAAGLPGGFVGFWDGDDGHALNSVGPVERPDGATDTDPVDVDRFAVSPDGRLLAASDWGLPVSIFDIATGAKVGEITTDEATDDPEEFGTVVFDIAWSPDGTHVVAGVGGADAGVIVISDRSGADVERLQEPEGVWPGTVRFDRHGQRLLSSSFDVRGGEVVENTLVWDLASASVVRSLPQASESLAVDPTGQLFATGRGLDGTIDIWDAESGAAVSSIGGSAKFDEIQFSPDGREIANGGQDGLLRVFDVRSGREVVVLEHASVVFSLAYSPDGSRIASRTYDGTVRVWTLDLDELIEVARSRVTRSLSDEECRQYLHVDRC